MPMDSTYPATYRDRHGEVATSIRNNGKLLSMEVRSITFAGSDFDDLEAPEDVDVSGLSQFTMQLNCLCFCVIEFQMPMPVVCGDGVVDATIYVWVELGRPTPNGGIDKQSVDLELRFGDNSLKSHGRSGCFDDELLDIQKQLPHGTFMKACVNCAFSDYHPAGSGMFGCMACFRDNKEAYLSVKSKRDIFTIWDTMTEYVQETYVCPEFQRRQPGTGYRG